MTHQIHVIGQDIGFPCAEDESILDAAERAGYALPYSCRKGVCMSCEGGVVTGTAEQLGRGVLIGPQSGVLFCQTRPRSGIEIAPRRIAARAPPVRKQITAFVFRANRPAPDVTLLHLRYPPQDRAHFRAGQYLQVLLPDGSRRTYSMAGPPQETDGTILHIRQIPGGRFSAAMLPTLTPGSRLMIELPFGAFTLSEQGKNRPTVLLAGGTGIAPITAMLEDALHRGADRPFHLYWGGRRVSDFYLGERIARWSAALPGFRYTPVLSEADGAWPGRRGLVHGAVLEDHPDLSGWDVYASGNPAMIEAARADFVRHGVASEAFFADAFVATGD